jgi:hypothetical protein
LKFPPTVPPPICLGITREKSLQLSGRLADGTLLCEPGTPDYIRWARSDIDRRRAAAGRCSLGCARVEGARPKDLGTLDGSRGGLILPRRVKAAPADSSR